MNFHNEPEFCLNTAALCGVISSIIQAVFRSTS